jgi:hypothetical protein
MSSVMIKKPHQSKKNSGSSDAKKLLIQPKKVGTSFNQLNKNQFNLQLYSALLMWIFNCLRQRNLQPVGLIITNIVYIYNSIT